MAFFNDFPYTNFHEMNLDWLLQQVKRQQAEIDELKKAAPDDVVWVTFTFKNAAWTCDKTYAQIAEAVGLNTEKLGFIVNGIKYRDVAIYIDLDPTVTGYSFYWQSIISVVDDTSAAVLFTSLTLKNDDTITEASYSATV